jgi:uncharacterized protein (DUF2267 family)
MSATGPEVFDTTLQKTNEWLNELASDPATPNRRRAYQALRAVLQALRDRLTVDEVAQLGAQLPMLVRGFYYEGWDPSAPAVPARHKDEFVAQVAAKLPGEEPGDPEAYARAVFVLLTHRITEGEIEDVKGILPKELRELWPQEAVKLT